MALISSNGTGGGNWSVGGTWVGGVVPAEGDCATVVVGDTVTIDDAALATIIIGDDHVGVAYAITINGKLQYLSTAAVDHIFRCKGDLVVASGGSLEIGTSANPIPAARTFTIELNYSAVLADGKYGLKNSGDMVLQGDSARITVTNCLLNADAAANATSLTTDVATGWKDNDDIAIASTTRTWSEAENGKMNGDAVGATLTVDGFGGAGGGLANAHSGTSPTQAEIINLTRNVKVTSFNTGFRGYVCCYLGSTSDIDYVEFYMLGINVVDKYGITIKTTGVGDTNFNGVSVWGTATDNSGFCLDGEQNIVLENFVIYGVDWIGIDCRNNSSNESITDGIIMRTGYRGFYLDFGGLNATIDNITVTSCAGWGFYIGKTASFSNLTIHSNSGWGLYIKVFSTLLENITVWRNNSYGLYVYSVVNQTYSTITAFGNNTRNIYLSRCVRMTLTLTLNGDTTFATTYGLYIAFPNVDITIIDSDLGTASGILTAHSHDIYIPSGTYVQVITKNSKLSSPSQVGNMNNSAIGSFVQCEDLGQIQYNDQGWYKYGKAIRDSTTFKTGSYSMRFDQFWAATDWLEYEVEIPVKDGESVVVSAWLRKNAAYTSANRPKIKLSGMGITATEDQMSDVTDTWEKVSVSGTPTRTGMAKLTIMTYLTNAGASAWCDFEKTGLTMPVLNTLEGSFWADGHIAQILFDTGSITAAEFWKMLTADIDKAGSYGNLFKDYLDAQISLIKAQTDKLQFAAGNDIKATLDGEKVALSDATEAEIDRILTATEIKQAAVNDASATTTKFVTTLTETTNTFWTRAAILFTSGNNKGQIRGIKSYNGATKEIQIQTPLSYAPANGDSFIILPARKFLTPDVLELADAVWDEVLTGATHNIPTSAGKRLRQIGAYNIHDGTAQDGSCYSITLAATASSTDHVYNRNLIVIVGGTGIGQTRTITDYDGTSKIVAVDRDWWITPDASSEYYILADDTPLVVDHGIAQGGADTSITLRSSASAIDETYTGGVVAIIASTGEGQSRLITGYNGTTKVATITPIWRTNPTSSSIYVVMPYGCSCVGNLTDAALTQIRSEIDANSTKLASILGLVHENIYIDNPSYDANKNLISARLRTYSVAGSVGTVNDVLATYTITAGGDGKGKFTSWKQVKQ